MSVVYVAIKPHDPIIARDGRPFGRGQGIRMRSLDWPYPSVLAGSLRTLLGKKNGGFTDEIVKALLAVQFAGPLPMKDMKLYLPAPKDILAKKIDEKIIAVPLRPAAIRSGEGCDLPRGGLLPTMLPDEFDEDFKPEKMPAFWSISKMIEWLANPNGSDFSLGSDPENDEKKDNKTWKEDENDAEGKKSRSDFLRTPEKDERVHTGIDPETGVAAVEEGLLFMSVGLDLSTTEMGGGVQLAAKIQADGTFLKQIENLNEIHPFGGERRLAQWTRTNESAGWICPAEIPAKLDELDSGKIRMILTTPAIFAKGWLPGWLELVQLENGKEVLEGMPPEALESQRLRLVSACIDRWRPISGWSAESKSRGPKAIRRLVPAGSVYFFEIHNGKEASALAKSHWLKSVCDLPQDRKDGFGLAVWGTWEEAKKENIKNKG